MKRQKKLYTPGYFVQIFRTTANISDWASTADLEDLIEGKNWLVEHWRNDPKIAQIENELDYRRHSEITKPHWIIVATLIVATLTLVIAVLAWLFPRTPN